MKHIIINTFFLLLTSGLFAQISTEGLSYYEIKQLGLQVKKDYIEAEQLREFAEAYFYNCDYEMAVLFYKRLFNNNSEVQSVDLKNYGVCLKVTGQYKLSEELIALHAERESKPYKKYNSERYFYSILEQSGRYAINHLESNRPESEYPVFYSKDQLYLLSARTGKAYDPKLDSKAYQLWTAKVNESQLFDFEKMVNSKSKFHNGGVAFSKDGKLAYFTVSNEKTQQLEIIRAVKKDGIWQKKGVAHFCQPDFSYAQPVFSKNESQLYFVSNVIGGYGGTDIYVADVLKNGKLGDPKNLGPKINTILSENFPSTSNESTLYFSSKGHNSIGGFDVFVAEIDSAGRYGNVTNVGIPINSSYDDFAYTQIDDKEGFFASNRKSGLGRDDIYTFKLIEPLRSIKDLNDSSQIAQISSFSLKDVNLPAVTVDEEGGYTSESTLNKGSYAMYLLDENGVLKPLQESILLDGDGHYTSQEPISGGDYFVMRKPGTTIATMDVLADGIQIDPTLQKVKNITPLKQGSYYFIPKGDVEITSANNSLSAGSIKLNDNDTYVSNIKLKGNHYYAIPTDVNSQKVIKQTKEVYLKDDGKYDGIAKIPTCNYTLFSDNLSPQNTLKQTPNSGIVNVASNGLLQSNADIDYTKDYYAIPIKRQLLANSKGLISDFEVNNKGEFLSKDGLTPGEYYLFDTDENLWEESKQDFVDVELNDNGTYTSSFPLKDTSYFIVPKNGFGEKPTSVDFYSDGTFIGDDDLKLGQYYLVPKDKKLLKNSDLNRNLLKVDESNTISSAKKLEQGDYVLIPLTKDLFDEPTWLTQNDIRDNPLEDASYYLLRQGVIDQSSDLFGILTINEDGSLSADSIPPEGDYSLLQKGQELFEEDEIGNIDLYITKIDEIKEMVLTKEFIFGEYYIIDNNKELKKSNMFSSVSGLKNIYFDLNSAETSKASVIELGNVVNYLEQNPLVKVRVSGHADQRGTAAYNEWLSNKRAVNAINYLTQHNISEDRIVKEVGGELFPIKKCNDGDCSEEFHALNRRVEFVIFE